MNLWKRLVNVCNALRASILYGNHHILTYMILPFALGILFAPYIKDCAGSYAYYVIPICVTVLIFVLCKKHVVNITTLFVILTIIFFVFGICSMLLRFYMLDIESGHYCPIDGKIIAKIVGEVEAIRKHDKGVKLTIVIKKMSDADKFDCSFIKAYKHRVRITMLNEEVGRFSIGDIVLFRASLMMPRYPSIPDGFNLAEYSYFNEIWAVGRSISNVHIVGKNVNLGVKGRINTVRHHIAMRILRVMSQPAAGVAIGLLIGDTSYIDSDTMQSLRDSGIAHLVAISGMHMVLIVGMVFFSVRYITSYFIYMTLHYNTKKIAAVMSIFISFIYLTIAGFPISAQRAFLVSCVFLFSILLDRELNSMRTLILGAFCILIISPESIKSPSLQMSFAACIGLISHGHLFNKEKVRILLIRHKAHDRVAKFIAYLASVLYSTLIASISTAPFIGYHFNTFSVYSAITNVICVPLNDIMIMLFGIIGVILMPVGLDVFPLYLMEIFLKLLIFIAKFISNIEGSAIYIPKLPNIAMLILTIGLFLYSLTKSYAKYLLLVMTFFTTAYLYIANKVIYDIVVPASGGVVVINDKGKYYLLKLNRSKYDIDVIKQYFGVKEWYNIDDFDSVVRDDTKYIIRHKSRLIALCYKKDCMLENKEKFDFVIDLWYNQHVERAKVGTVYLTLFDLKEDGGHLIYYDDKICSIKNEKGTFKIG